MIDETLLADPTRCPDCATPLTAARDACPRCDLLLTGPVAGRLWQASLQAAEALRIRAGLLAELRARTEAQTAPAAAALEAAAVPVAPAPRPHRQRAEWSVHRVQNLLLALGVVLLAVAAIIFVAVSWDRLGVGGRSAVMAGVTGLAAAGALTAYRRGLLSTAEWLSLLTVGLALLDCYGARTADLAGLAAVDGAAFWAGALAVVTGLAALLAVVLPTRVLPLAAALLGQLSVPLLAADLATDVAHPLALSAAFLGVQAVVGLTVAALWPAGSRTADARAVVATGSALAFLGAAVDSAGAAYAETGSLVVGTALLLVLAGVAVAAGTVLAASPAVLADPASGDAGRVAGCDGLAAVLLVAAAWAPLVDQVREAWVPAAMAGTVLLLLAGVPLLPRARREVPGHAVLAATFVPLLATADEVAAAVERMVQPLDRAWDLTASTAGVDGGWPTVLALVGVGAVLLLAAAVLRRPVLRLGSLPVLAGAAALTAPAAGAGYPVQLGALVVLAGLLLAAGARLDVHGLVRTGWTALGCGGAGILLAVAWSFATPVATLVGLPAVVGALVAGLLAARDAEALRSWRVLLVVASLVLGLTEAGALARHDGAGWSAVWSLVLVLAAATAAGVALLLSLRTADTDEYWAPLHTAAVGISTAAAVAAAWLLADWRDVELAGRALAACCTAAVLVVAACAPSTTRRPVRRTAQVVAAAAGLPALSVSAVDPDRLWVALLVAGLATAVAALTSTQRVLGWAAGVLLAASSWVRLALSDVVAPEAYTVPGGVALLVVGYLRRRRDPEYGSWQAYGSGLSLALVPSLLRAVSDSGDLRPLLLALVAAAVVGVGAVRRLQAPLLLGGAVLAIDALVQLAPYLAAVYEVVPRWITIGSLGLALLVAGATYEQRVRDLRRVGRTVARLG